MRKILVKPGGPSVAFIAPSTPLLMQKKVMEIMTTPETTAEAWDTSRRAALGLPDLPSLIAGASGSTALGEATNTLLRVFQRAKDLEHPIRDKSWRDLWDLADAMRQAGSATKTLVLVSGDVHHNYCMTGNLSGSGRPKPEFLQITCSGLQTTIRSSFDKWLAKELGNQSFNVGKRRLVPGFMFKNRTGNPDLALFHNAVAFVEVSMGAEVGVRVRYLSGADEHVYRYTSGAAYMRNGEPTVSPWQDRSDPRTDLRDLKRQAEWAETEPREDDQADALTVAIVIDQPSDDGRPFPALERRRRLQQDARRRRCRNAIGRSQGAAVQGPLGQEDLHIGPPARQGIAPDDLQEPARTGPDQGRDAAADRPLRLCAPRQPAAVDVARPCPGHADARRPLRRGSGALGHGRSRPPGSP